MPKSQEMKTTNPLVCLKETPKAFLFQTTDEPRETFWIPKSQIKDPDPSEIAEGVIGEITIPFWLAEEKDLA